MNTATKLAAFAAAVAVAFGGAMVVGAAVGPVDVSGDSSHSGQRASATGSSDLPRGLAIAEAGYRFAPETPEIDPIPSAAPTTFAFRILDDNGNAVTDFEDLHERALHLIVLSRNLVDYLHLHPTMDTTGRWTVQIPALSAGSYRIFADFQPHDAANITLGADLMVAGTVAVVALPQPAATATVDDYTVKLDGTPAVGAEPLRFTVQRHGTTVRTDPYLGAAGHLVAIRSGDLAYLHVHPEGDATTPVVMFVGEFPTPGTYRLFFDFSHNGTVHTAAFTVDVPQGHGDDSMTTHSEGQ